MFDIAAIWHRDGKPLESEFLGRLAASLQDYAGAWRDPIDVAAGSAITSAADNNSWALLSLNRLRQSAARVVHGGGDVAVAADCHLHNRRQLRADLQVPDEPIADDQLIALAYQKWGVDLAEHLSGDFAFCLFDQASNRLLIARDRLGCKPLYYAEHAGHAIVCSQIKPILQSGLVPQAIYQPRLADHIVLRSESAEPQRTFFEHVYRVLPAHRMLFTAETTKAQRYWSLQPPPRLQLGSTAEYAEAMRSELSDAVQRCMQKGERIASMLSGGMDSSAVSALAKKLSDTSENFFTVSAIAELDKHSIDIETRASRSAAAAIGAVNYSVTPQQFVHTVGDLTAQFSNSTNMFDSLMMNTSLAVAGIASAQQADVLLDGLDGELVAGFSAGSPLKQYTQSFQLAAVSVELSRLAAIERLSKFSVLRKFVMRPLLKQLLPSKLSRAVQARNDAADFHSVVRDSGINPHFAQQVSLAARLREVGFGLLGDTNLSHAQQHAQRVQHPSFMMALERYERVARNHALQARHPLMDIRFVEFCLSLPAELKHDGLNNKALLRSAMQGLLSSDITTRPYNPRDHLGPEFRQAWLKSNNLVKGLTGDDEYFLNKYFNNENFTSSSAEYANIGSSVGWSLSSFLLWMGNQHS